MQINRRPFLQLLGSTGLLLASPRLAKAADPGARALFLLIDGITPEVQAGPLRDFLEPFAQASIPVGLGLAPGPEGYPDATGQLLRTLFGELPDLFEPVAAVAGLSAMEPYFQMRNASRALDEIEAALGIREEIASISTAAPARPVNFDALRAVGVRNVIATTTHAEALVSLPCDGGALCLKGSVPVTLDAGAVTLREWLRTGAAGSGVLGVVQAGDLTGSASVDIAAAAEAMVAEIVRAVQGGSVFVVPPREHLAWYVGTQARTLALRLELPPDGDLAARQGFESLGNALRTSGIPFSLSGPAATIDDDGCLVLGPGGDAAGWIAARSAAGQTVCAVGTVDRDGSHDLAMAGLDLLVVPEQPGGARLDAEGMPIWPDTEDPARIGQGRRGIDVVLSLAPRNYRDPSWRATVVEALVAVKEDRFTKLRSVAGLAADLVPADPVFAILRETRRDMRTPEDAAPETIEDRDTLLADARDAWRYVELWTNAATGLCPATVHRGVDGTYRYEALTMWDFGSLIRATISAHELGFLSDEAFLARARLLVGALPAASIRGHLLPNELIATDRIGPLSQNFNACDTGRLVGALVDLDRHPVSRGLAGPMLEKWDLDAIVLDGRPHSISGSRLVDTFVSHCTAYLARNFRDIGIAVASPYSVDSEGSETDWQMRLLYAAARLGAYGAEPLLLEAIERGPTREMRLLADVLWTEQLRAYDRTGLLHCVSEAPLNTPPWFAYAGLRLNDARTRWEVRSNSPDPRYATDAFQRQSLLVNTKGAFLWAAIRPGAHAARLVSHVRTYAKLQTGEFTPGAFVYGAPRMEGYADINTNGIVMEAVAYILRGRRPSAEVYPP
jgi:hypothetical protein